MKRIRIAIVTVTFALISALAAIAQSSPGATPATQPSAQSPATQPAPQTTQPATTTYPAQQTSTQPATTPAQQTTTPPAQVPPQPGASAASGDKLSDPSMQAAPAPQGCTQKEKDRTRMRESCGYLLDATGKPAANASLELVESGQQNAYLFVFARTLTDAQGRFDFGPVPSGHYLLRTPQNAPMTVYNFVSLETQNADGQCKKPVEVKAAAAGQCNSEVHAGKGSFPTEMGAQTRSKGDTSSNKGQTKQP